MFNKLINKLSSKFKPSYEGKNKFNKKDKPHGMWLEGPVEITMTYERGSMGGRKNYLIWSEGSYENGVRIGLWTSYYDHNGKVAFENNYIKGDHLYGGSQPNLIKEFYPSGELSMVRDWHDNKKNNCDMDEQTYFKNGNLESEIIVRKGKSSQISYYKSGQVFSESITEKTITNIKYFNKKGHMVHHVKRNKDNEKEIIHGTWDEVVKLI